MVVPVAGWRVEEDALAVLFVGQLDDEFALLVGCDARGKKLVAAGDELCAGCVSTKIDGGGRKNLQLWLCGEVGRVGLVCCKRAPLHIAEEVWFVGVFDAARQVVGVAVIVLRAGLGRSGDQSCVFGVSGIEDTLRTLEYVAVKDELVVRSRCRDVFVAGVENRVMIVVEIAVIVGGLHLLGCS